METTFGRDTLQLGNWPLDKLGAGYVMLTSKGNYDGLADFLGDTNINNNGNFKGIETDYDVPYDKNFKVGPGYVSTTYPWEASTYYWKRVKFKKYSYDGIKYHEIENEFETIDEMIVQGHDLRYVINFCYSSSNPPNKEYPGDNFKAKMILDLFVDQLFY